MTNSPAPGQIHSNVVPSEVGWQFVPQYYTFVNKQPHRLHCFYTKSSTFIHGTEGEDGKPCFGQQEIHNRITAIGFQDCKVFIHSVDAQSSANGGIIIQVIGEMSNRGEEWRKFVQTFFLAEQPNGYFVLNDIFRFLKDETVQDSEEDREEELPAQDIPAPSTPSPEQVTAPILDPPPEPVSEHVSAPSTPPSVQEPVADDSEPQPELHTNGFHTHAAAEPDHEPDTSPIENSLVPSPSVALTPEPSSPAPVTPAVSIPAPPPAASPAVSPQPSQPPAQPTPPPQPPIPAVPKTWATLAASSPGKWGSAVAQGSKGTTEVPAPSPNAPPSPIPHSPGPAGHRDQHPLYIAAQNVTTAQCFVKGVVESITEPALKQVITTKFGPIKDLEIVRGKACAFLEFQNLDSAKRAIIASLQHQYGGSGGIRIDTEGGQHTKIFVETKKERSERPVSRPRGGGPGQGVNGGGDGRGGYRGRGGPGRGRGGPK